jgi:hypothetical protein
MESTFIKVLRLVYADGVNDGMREAIPGRSKEIVGEDTVVLRAVDLLHRAGVTINED